MARDVETAQNATESQHLCCDLVIPVPWGHIAVKTWNDPCGWPVLCAHGLQDNAATFDRLFPLLPPTYYFVSVDLPGHGKSSHFPPGLTLNFFDCVTVIKRILTHLKWTKCIFLGHSLGGQVGAFFTAMYPECVTKLIMIDVISTSIRPAESMMKRHRKLFESLLETEKKMSIKEAPSYSYQEAVTRMVKNRSSKLTLEAADLLVNRSLVASLDGYRFTTDQRLKYGLRPLIDFSVHMEVVNSIACQHLVIFAQDSMSYFLKSEVNKLFEAYKRKPNFNFTVVDGNHDVHNNHPERVALIITNYLNSVKCAL